MPEVNVPEQTPKNPGVSGAEQQVVTMPNPAAPEHMQTPGGRSDGTAADVGPSRQEADAAVREAQENATGGKE